MTEHPISDAVLAAKAATGHSVFGASAAPMFMNCLGSLIPNLLADDESSYEAAEGTVAHYVAETWLKDQATPWHLLDTVMSVPRRNGEPHQVTITEEMFAYVEEYCAWVGETPGTHYVELKVDYSAFTPIPNQGGTADHVFVEWQKLTITDLKYGKGIKVYARDHEQTQAYAMGVFLKLDWLYDFQEIVIRICQPRLDHFDEWVISRADLLTFMERFREKAFAAWVPGAPRTPGPKQCQWCKIRTDCPALLGATTAVVQGQFPDDDEPLTYDLEALQAIAAETEMISAIQPAHVPKLTVEALSRALVMRPIIERWLREVEEHLEYLAESGVELPFHEMKRGRAGRRAWINKNEAAKFLLQHGAEKFDLYTTILASPAQAEELLKIATRGSKAAVKAMLDPYVIQPPGRITLALKSDKRMAVEPASSAFPD